MSDTDTPGPAGTPRKVYVVVGCSGANVILDVPLVFTDRARAEQFANDMEDDWIAYEVREWEMEIPPCDRGGTRPVGTPGSADAMSAALAAGLPALAEELRQIEEASRVGGETMRVRFGPGGGMMDLRFGPAGTPAAGGGEGQP